VPNCEYTFWFLIWGGLIVGKVIQRVPLLWTFWCVLMVAVIK